MVRNRDSRGADDEFKWAAIQVQSLAIAAHGLLLVAACMAAFAGGAGPRQSV